jgi:quinol monooxygenase YgiN
LTVLYFERFPVDPAGEERFKQLVFELLERIRAAGGALWADAARAFDDEPSYVLLSEWRTTADLDAWDTSEDAGVFRDRSDPHLRGEVTRRRFETE